MKRMLFLLFLELCLPISVTAKRLSVKLNKCTDGDTAYFNAQNEVLKVRFLAIDTPKIKHPTKRTEPYGKAASNYTCETLLKENSIILESDLNASKDKYDRFLYWIFVNDELLQEQLLNRKTRTVRNMERTLT